ncbi:MAG: ATP-dependent helicase [Gammaproteobacteria bacterium]|nr:ATP-dependent helicase [Gammaproteobacteria bacterium]
MLSGNKAAADYLAPLNANQRLAASCGVEPDSPSAAGPILIIAGAGTGKTNTLAYRVAHLLACGVHPDRILLLTFSRRAAREMTRRAVRIAATVVPGNHRLSWSGTFHSIANRLLRQYARRIGLHADFTVMDRSDSADLMDMIRQDLRLARGRRRFPKKNCCSDIYSRTVNTRGELEDVLEKSFPWCAEWSAELRSLFRGYVAAKQSANVLDYDDLLLCWRLLMNDAALAGSISERFDHILVDEYQDTNRLQAEILLRIRPDGSGLTVVGDDAQSIYSFRAASVENILAFPAQFDPPATVVSLEENYRSVQPVLDTANALMASGSRQYDKKLRAVRSGGARPRYATVADDEAQADYVMSAVIEARERGQLLRQQAVLFRSAHHSDRLELELMRANIPYVKYGGLKFLEAAHVKDLLALLRWAENPRDRMAMFRVVQLISGCGPRTAARAHEFLGAAHWQVDALSQFRAPAGARDEWFALAALMFQLAAKADSWPESMDLAASWYRPQIEVLYDSAQARAGDIDQLQQIAGQFASRERFLTELTLDPPAAAGDLAGSPLLDDDYLVLSTVHSAKGQEWDSVFVLNVADGNFPSEFATGDAELIEEERRLLYVAMTRAKKDLHLLAPLRYYVPQQARHGDGHVYGARSRFMDDAVLACCERLSWPVAGEQSEQATSGDKVLDVGSKLTEMW